MQSDAEQRKRNAANDLNHGRAELRKQVANLHAAQDRSAANVDRTDAREAEGSGLLSRPASDGRAGSNPAPSVGFDDCARDEAGVAPGGAKQASAGARASLPAPLSGGSGHVDLGPCPGCLNHDSPQSGDASGEEGSAHALVDRSVDSSEQTPDASAASKLRCEKATPADLRLAADYVVEHDDLSTAANWLRTAADEIERLRTRGGVARSLIPVAQVEKFHRRCKELDV